MSERLLIENFDQLASAPDGIRKLRELVLLLAFQGKLAPPDETVVQVDDLIQEITNEKATLATQRLLRPEKPLPEITQSEIPYPLPRNWRWVRLGDIVNYGGAEKVEANEIKDEDWVLDLEDIEKDTSRIVQRLRYKDRSSKSSKARFAKGDVLYGKLRPYLNKVVVADSGGYCTTEIIPIHIYTGIASEYLKFALMRLDYLKYVVAKSYGIKMPRLGTDDARRALFPLAPTGEQFRIAEKIREMMAHLDDLEAHRQKQTEARLTLNASALTHLVDAKKPKTFAIHWKRIHDNFDLIYDTPETVGELRKAILQLAVQGKLVPQDPKDEPASTLLERIKVEKEKLIAGKKIRKSEPLPPIKPEEIPYELPKGWEWVRLGDAINPRFTISYGVLVPGPEVNRGVPFVRLQDLDVKHPNEKPNKSIDPEIEAHYARTRLIGGEILLGVVGSIGKIGVAPETWKGANIARAVCRIAANGYLNRDFLVYALQSPKTQDFFISSTRTLAQPTLNVSLLEKTLIPIPPHQEQDRICHRLDQLWSLTDQLESLLQQSQVASDQLMEAVVREVVSTHKMTQKTAQKENART